MAGKYTYDEFQAALNASGLAGEFSAADLKLAQQNPDAGMSILNYKRDWHSAATDEARALANQGAERVRSGYGEYTGGKDGGAYYLNPLSPGSFSYDAAPSYKGGVGGDVAELWDRQKNYGSFSYGAAPTYTSRYDGQIQDLLGQIVNRQDFSYDPATDPLYSQYRKQYAREGQRATADALGAAAAASGGLPSSYAQTAAGQAANYYAGQMTDKIPELYQLAYNKYLSDYQLKQSDLAAVQGAEQSDYTKFLDRLGQYNTDRNFAYGVYSDEYDRLANDLATARAMDADEYSRYLTELDQYNRDRSFAYNQLLDEVSSQSAERSEALQRALTAAQYGDYRFLNDMGVDTANNPADYERRYNEAVLAAQYGDYSRLNQLGINPDFTNVNNAALASSGEYTGNAGLTEEQIMQLQYYLGVTMDGWYGPESMAATGGMTAAEAYQAMLSGTLPRGSGGTYDGGEVYSGSGGGSYGGGSSGGGRSAGAAAGLTAADVSAIKSQYGSTLTQAEAAALMSVNPGLTEAALTAAGFTIARGTMAATSPTGLRQDPPLFTGLSKKAASITAGEKRKRMEQ